MCANNSIFHDRRGPPCTRAIFRIFFRSRLLFPPKIAALAVPKRASHLPSTGMTETGNIERDDLQADGED